VWSKKKMDIMFHNLDLLLRNGTIELQLCMFDNINRRSNINSASTTRSFSNFGQKETASREYAVD
jgi:hypothetical protein